MPTDRDALYYVVPHVGPRPNIWKALEPVLDKLFEKGVTPQTRLATLDWYIGTLFAIRSWVVNHEAGGKDYDLKTGAEFKGPR